MLLRWSLLAASVPAVAAEGQAVTGWGPLDVFRTCMSDIDLGPMQAWDKKGLTVEDTTLMFCPEKVPEIWPNTLAPVRSIRLFRAWHENWDPEFKSDVPKKVVSKEDAWRALQRFLISNGAKVLLGTQVTCSANDDRDFQYVKDLATMLGPDHVLGLGVGNEIDLLYSKMSDDKTVNDACIRSIWDGGKYWEKFQDRVKQFSELGPGFEHIPVTAVFSAAALGGNPFQETPGKALVNSFLKNATSEYGKRFVFAFNHYTYFDPHLQLDPGSSSCENALAEADCWENTCMTPKSMADARVRMRRLTGEDDYLYWVGETGWSSPRPKTLGTHMSACWKWSSLATFERFYGGFVKWSLEIPGERPPDYIFYFSVRTSLNFGNPEYFGLIDQCSNVSCKVMTENYTAPVSNWQKQQDILNHWRIIGFIAVGSLTLVSLVGSAAYVTIVPTSWKSSRTLSTIGGYESQSSSSDSE